MPPCPFTLFLRRSFSSLLILMMRGGAEGRVPRARTVEERVRFNGFSFFSLDGASPYYLYKYRCVILMKKKPRILCAGQKKNYSGGGK